jgi:hypothetical protein
MRQSGFEPLASSSGGFPSGPTCTDIAELDEPGGMGLITMRRRAEAIGGTLTVASPAGSGTRITLDFDPHGRRERRTWWRAMQLPVQRGAKRRG